MKYGYARVSSTEQNLDRQIALLREWGVEPDDIFAPWLTIIPTQSVLFLRLHLINRDTALATARDTMTDFYVILTEYQSVFRRKNCVISCVL